jgi:hypothetical protein
MLDVTMNDDGRAADFTVAAGCMVCAGDLQVRVTAVGAYTFCPHCHWISKPAVAFQDGSLTVAYRSVAKA